MNALHCYLGSSYKQYCRLLERLSLHIFFDEAVYIQVCCKFERIQRLQNRLLDNVKIYGDRDIMPFLTHFVTMLQSCWAPQATLPLRC